MLYYEKYHIIIDIHKRDKQMKITRKIITILVVPFILTLLTSFSILLYSFTSDIQKDEKKHNLDSVLRAINYISTEKTKYSDITNNIADFNEDFIHALTKDDDIMLKQVLLNVKLSFIGFYDNKGEYIGGKYLDFDKFSLSEFKNEDLFKIEKNIKEKGEGYSDIVQINGSTYILNSVKFNNEHGTSGIMFTGRKFDNDMVTIIDSLVGGKIETILLKNLNNDIKEKLISAENGYFVSAIKPESDHISYLMPTDNTGDDTVVIKITIPGDYYTKTTYRYHTVAIIFIILFILLICAQILFILKYINKPIKALNNKIKRIDRNNVNIGRINISEGNEISTLAHTIDELLNEVEAGRAQNKAIQAELMQDISKRVSIEERLRLILNSAAEGIFGVDLDNNFTFCNISCLCLLGYDSTEELRGMNISKIFKSCISLTNKDKCLSACTDTFKRKDGTEFIAEYYSYPQIVNGETVGLVITFFDITHRRKMEDMLRESERSKAVLLKNLIGMAYRCKNDEDWTMMFVSEGCYELTGYKAERLLNNNDISYNELILKEYREYLRIKWDELLKNRGVLKEEYQITTASGEKKWVLEQGRGVYNEKGEVIALEGLIVDISAQKKRESEIQYLSYHDNLTGVYNRIYFEEAKNRLIREDKHPISVIVGDIDGLKFINDAFGHTAGDELIAKTASILENCCREDDVIARVGGDEFNILLPNTTGDESYVIMKRMQAAISDFSKTNDKAFSFTVSLGYSTKESSDDEFNDIIKAADDYMYKRKLLEHQSSHSHIIASIKETMTARSIETDKHSERMAEMSRMIAKALNLSEKEMDELELLSALHDIGKVGINDTILKKKGPLTKEEWIEMKKHPVIGYRIAMSTSELKSIAAYILSHHERWDGTGYPEGLKGEEIPLISRILSVIDAYDAMTNNRVYRDAITKEEALTEIGKNAGIQFDPYIVEVFIKWMRTNEKNENGEEL